jgi:hypothetical protein
VADLPQEELDLIQAGADYRELKRTPAWPRLVKHLVTYCNNREGELLSKHDADNETRLRLLDTWQACEHFYQEIITEVDGTIRMLEEKERELRELGIQYPELSIGPTGQGDGNE